MNSLQCVDNRFRRFCSHAWHALAGCDDGIHVGICLFACECFDGGDTLAFSRCLNVFFRRFRLVPEERLDFRNQITIIHFGCFLPFFGLHHPPDLFGFPVLHGHGNRIYHYEAALHLGIDGIIIDFINEPFSECFFGAHPRFLIHETNDFIHAHLAPGAVLVHVDYRLLDLRQGIRHFTECFCVQHVEYAGHRIVDHVQGIFRHDDFTRAACHDRGSTRADPVDVGRHLAWICLQHVVNSLCCENVATWAIDTERDILPSARREIVGEFLRALVIFSPRLFSNLPVKIELHARTLDLVFDFPKPTHLSHLLSLQPVRVAWQILIPDHPAASARMPALRYFHRNWCPSFLPLLLSV